MTHVDPVLGNTARPRAVLGDDLAARDRRRQIMADVDALAEATGTTKADALEALADADGNVTAALRAFVAAQTGEQPPADEQPTPARSAEDIRRIARQIRGDDGESSTPAHIEEIAKRIRGPF
ncbi:hypothetical protein [Micromonospora sp. NPDC005197]|uniref:hypothetical protein n=1 Tax=Micromonospora sp. NPDC005197 TaxID=3157020 RepID=UPI0033A00F65